MNAIALVRLLIPTPFCDWHSSHHSSSASDPVIDAYIVATYVAAGVGIVLGLAGGGLLTVFTRRIRHMFWAIPALNLAGFVAYLLARPAPGGTSAQFYGQGRPYTIIALILLLLSSLAVATVLALIRVAVRLVRRVSRRQPPPPPVRP